MGPVLVALVISNKKIARIQSIISNEFVKVAFYDFKKYNLKKLILSASLITFKTSYKVIFVLSDV